MSVGAAFLTVMLLGVVLAVILGPLYALPSLRARDPNRRADLDVRREAKYQEIRDAALDFETGKLSQEDYEAVDGALRREALGILDEIEAEEAEEAELAATTKASA